MLSYTISLTETAVEKRVADLEEQVALIVKLFYTEKYLIFLRNRYVVRRIYVAIRPPRLP